jgi:hypothetical protein
MIHKKVGPVIESLGLKDKSSMLKVESSILNAFQLPSWPGRLPPLVLRKCSMIHRHSLSERLSLGIKSY